MKLFGQSTRFISLGIIFVVGFVGLGYKLGNLHLKPNQAVLTTLAKNRTYEKRIKGTRGKILDRKGNILSLDHEVKHVAVDPNVIGRQDTTDRYARGVAVRLSHILSEDLSRITDKIRRTHSQFVYIKKNVHAELATQIENLNLKGVLLEGDMSRSYPKGQLMSQVVGFANRNGVGAAGIELVMDDYLRGQSGIIIGEKDGRRHERYDRRKLKIESAEGANIYLTLDETLQFIVEEALAEAMQQHNAIGAWAVMMKVETGEILAMASFPSYDLNEYAKSEEDERRNRTLSGVYESGSIAKPITMAIAYNEGKFDPDEMINCENGRWIHRKRLLRDYHPYGLLPGWKVLQKSSNIGTAKIALRLEPVTFDRYLRNFGFGKKTGIELPGEDAGLFPKVENWNGLTHSRVAIGHGFSVTGLQMCNAINAIANDGYLMKPQIISKVTNKEGRLIYKPKIEAVGRPIREDTAKLIRELMAKITVPGGTGRRAAQDDKRYSTGGKTGTAQKPINGRYSDSKNIASFVGFVPAEKPVFTLLVSVDEPQPLHTGGQVAAPVFKAIAEQAIRYMHIMPQGDVPGQDAVPFVLPPSDEGMPATAE